MKIFTKKGLKIAGAATVLCIGAAAPSLAAPPPNSCTYATIKTVAGCTLTSGDKSIIKVTANNTVVPLLPPPPAGQGFEDQDFLTFSDDGTTWSLTWNFTPGAVPNITNSVLSAGLQLTVTDPLKVLDTASISFVKSGASTIPGTDSTFSASMSNGGPSLATNAATSGSFVGAVTNTTVAFAFVTYPGQTVSSATLNLTQKDAPPVPAPLPLLGGATAFACSRKLRRRIKATA